MTWTILPAFCSRWQPSSLLSVWSRLCRDVAVHARSRLTRPISVPENSGGARSALSCNCIAVVLRHRAEQRRRDESRPCAPSNRSTAVLQLRDRRRRVAARRRHRLRHRRLARPGISSPRYFSQHLLARPSSASSTTSAGSSSGAFGNPSIGYVSHSARCSHTCARSQFPALSYPFASRFSASRDDFVERVERQLAAFAWPSRPPPIAASRYFSASRPADEFADLLRDVRLPRPVVDPA